MHYVEKDQVLFIYQIFLQIFRFLVNFSKKNVGATPQYGLQKS